MCTNLSHYSSFTNFRALCWKTSATTEISLSNDNSQESRSHFQKSLGRFKKIRNHPSEKSSSIWATILQFCVALGRHFSHQNLPTLFYAPSLETDKALNVTSFTVNLFGTDEILALRLKATLAKNFAALLVWHVFEPSELNGRNVHGSGNSKPLDARI